MTKLNFEARICQQGNAFHVYIPSKAWRPDKLDLKNKFVKVEIEYENQN